MRLPSNNLILAIPASLRALPSLRRFGKGRETSSRHTERNMDKFTTLTGVAAPLPIMNVDTDMIIPSSISKPFSAPASARASFRRCAIATTVPRIPISS